MTGTRSEAGWWTRGLYHEPRGGAVSWTVLVLAVLYSLLAPQYYLHTIVAVPFVLLFPIAEVLPAERVRLAGMLRTVGLVYMCTTPIILFALF